MKPHVGERGGDRKRGTLRRRPGRRAGEGAGPELLEGVRGRLADRHAELVEAEVYRPPVAADPEQS